MKKRGLSTIVVTLIIILLSLVAVGVVWVVVRNLLVNGSKEAQIGTLTVSLSIKKAFEQQGNITVNVRRNVGTGELSKIKFVISDGTTSEVVTQDASMAELDEKSFSIHPTKLIATQVETVSVAPVVQTTDGESTGELTGTYNLISGVSTNGNNGNNGNSGACTSICSGNGIQYRCGDDSCGVLCGTCPSGNDCNNHVCVPIAGCQEPPNSTTCGNWVCGTKTSICGNLVSCDTGVCKGQLCDTSIGTCVGITPVSSGKVGDTWVSGMYFSSSDLPKDMTGLVGDYVDFSVGSAETKCWMIARWVLPTDTPGYPNSHIGFSFTTQIKTGDYYNIWDSSDKCQANLTSS